MTKLTLCYPFTASQLFLSLRFPTESVSKLIPSLPVLYSASTFLIPQPLLGGGQGYQRFPISKPVVLVGPNINQNTQEVKMTVFFFLIDKTEQCEFSAYVAFNKATSGQNTKRRKKYG